jgi:hyperosmotically inducible periplasmic protein
MKKLFLVLGLILGLMISMAAAPQEKAKSSAKAKSEKPVATAVMVDDTTLAKNVKETLASAPSLKDVPIAVEAKSGVVTLTGEVKNAGMKGTATRMTRKVAGVKSVNNQIKIIHQTKQPKPAKPASK